MSSTTSKICMCDRGVARHSDRKTAAGNYICAVCDGICCDHEESPVDPDVIALLTFMRDGLFPGKGKQQAKLVREICARNDLNEDRYLPHFMVKNKKQWGLTDG